jgi:hypothetical protein
MGPQLIAGRVLELLEGIALEEPAVDEELVADRLRAYLRALGLQEERVRFHPDIRALRRARVWPAQDRGPWPQLTGRQSWLLDRPVARRWGWREGRWIPLEAALANRAPRLERLVEADRMILRVGLGILVEPSAAPRRVAALLPLAEAAAAGLFAHAVGWHDRVIVLVALARPRMRFDAEGRLHDWDGLPAAEWRNGKGLYFWHGVEMTESAGSRPEAVTPRRVLGWANAERRRVAIERMGIDTFMRAVGAEVVQQDDYGRLWQTSREIDGEPFVAVEVVNATEEPDGSRNTYFLRVPPSVRTARRAVAWTFGLTRRAYMPAVES